MKTFILSSEAEADVTAKEFLITGTSVGVKPAVGATASVGVAEITALAGGSLGVIKQGLVKVTAVAATYQFGDVIELDATGQKVVAGTTAPVGTVAEDLVLSADGELLIYLNVA